MIADVQRYIDYRITDYVRWKASLGYQIYASSLSVLHNGEDCRITLVNPKRCHVSVIVVTHESCNTELIKKYKFYDRVYHFKIYSKCFNRARDIYINKTIDIDDYYNLTVDVPFYEVEEDLVRNKVAVTD